MERHGSQLPARDRGTSGRGRRISVIRSWLGQVSLDATNHYAQANLETKRKALERVGVRPKAGKLPRWRSDRSVLEWLDSL